METFNTECKYYLRKHIRHYGEYTNSIHEGTNRGLKFNAAPVTPCTRLDNSIVILSQNGCRTSQKKMLKSARDICATKPHAKLKCANELIDVAEVYLQKIQRSL